MYALSSISDLCPLKLNVGTTTWLNTKYRISLHCLWTMSNVKRQNNKTKQRDGKLKTQNCASPGVIKFYCS